LPASPKAATARRRLGLAVAALKGTRAPVAQLDRAPDYESGGQEFESLRARQLFQILMPGGSLNFSG
jgi:hypothetical protein